MQIKVTNTRMHKVDLNYLDLNILGEDVGKIKNQIKNIPVTEAQLVLVECNVKKAWFWKDIGSQLRLMTDASGIIHQKNKFYKPILISLTEKIEVGDWYYCKEENVTLQADYEPKGKGIFKILALPEHFSPQQLQMIVDGKLKEGKCLLECESFRDLGVIAGDRGIVNRIKLNPHITIYPVVDFSLHDAKKFALEKFNVQDLKNKYPNGGSLKTEHIQSVLEVGVECGYKFAIKSKLVEEKMYTRLEVRTILHKFNNPQSNEEVFKLNTWFEQNVK